MPNVQNSFSRSVSRGMTLIEVVIAVSLMVLVFFGFFGAYAASADLVRNASARTGASSLIASRMDYIRSLPYASVGTVGGTPSGTLIASESRTLNGIAYTVRTVVILKDDSANGAGSDYKAVKVAADWNFRGAVETMYAITYVAP